jgi:large conductance mechanosensitive channel
MHSVGDIFMPAIGAITGGLDFSNYYVALSSKVTADSLVEAKKQGAVLAWGNFVTIVINFLIVAGVLFFFVNMIQKVRQQEEAKAAPAPPRQEILLQEIRDLLAKK